MRVANRAARHASARGWPPPRIAGADGAAGWGCCPASRVARHRGEHVPLDRLSQRGHHRRNHDVAAQSREFDMELGVKAMEVSGRLAAASSISVEQALGLREACSFVVVITLRSVRDAAARTAHDSRSTRVATMSPISRCVVARCRRRCRPGPVARSATITAPASAPRANRRPDHTHGFELHDGLPHRGDASPICSASTRSPGSRCPRATLPCGSSASMCADTISCVTRSLVAHPAHLRFALPMLAWSDHTQNGVGKPNADRPLRTCLGDAMFPAVNQATVTLLERLGHTVVFPVRPNRVAGRCTRPGYAREALPLVRNYVDTFETALQKCDAIVAPSGSCVASVRHQHASVARDAGATALAERAAAVGARTYELSELLVDVLGVTDVGATTRIASLTIPLATRCGCYMSTTSRCGFCEPCAGSISSNCRRPSRVAASAARLR